MARPKIIMQLYPVLPAKDEAERKAKRPLGADSDLYYRTVHEWTDIIRQADSMGLWGCSTIEHHLHSEGYEVGPNPGVLNAHWASHIKTMRVGALGYVMATQDPIRVAEETAIIDHLTHGKYFVGFARGYQSRWTNILGQATGTLATASDGGDADRHTREVFEERVQMVLDCWTNEAVSLDGKYYQAPYPASTGIVGYPGVDIARTAGATGEVDANGAVRLVSVVPKPRQRPHPPIFMSVNKSRETIAFAAKHGFRPCYFSPGDSVVGLANTYLDEARKAGRAYRPGERQNVVRQMRIAKSAAEFERRLKAYDVDIYKNFYSHFGIHHVDPSEQSDDAAFKAMVGSGFMVGGTVDDTIRYWQALLKKMPFEYITLIWHFAQQPKDLVLEELQLFMEKVVPELEVPDYPDTI